MNENATFFRNRDEDSGETYQLSLKTARGLQGFSVYCRRPLQSKWFSDRDLAQRDVAGFSKRLQEVVATKGGGGIVVTVSGEDGRRTVEVKQIGGEMVAPASRFVMLAPGLPAQFVPIAATRKLPPGTHAIVPINADAEERLAGFVEQLPWLSPDFEALVLNAIRRPSLDVRLSNVEMRLFGQSVEEPSPRGWAQMKLRLRKALSKPAPYAIASLILLTLLLAESGYLLWTLRSKINKGSAGASAGAATATDTGKTVPPNPQPGTSSDAPAQETLVTKTRELLQELRKSRDAHIRSIYDTHFKAFDDQLTDEKIKSWFAVQKPPQGESGSRPLLWGIMKLQALALQPTDKSFVAPSDAFTATMNIINKSDNTEAKQLAAALSCRLGYSKRQYALPEAECDKLKDDDIKNGLTSLIKFVKNPK